MKTFFSIIKRDTGTLPGALAPGPFGTKSSSIKRSWRLWSLATRALQSSILGVGAKPGVVEWASPGALGTGSLGTGPKGPGSSNC